MDFVHIFIYLVKNNKFVTFFKFIFFLSLCYFPQHCLYFLPLPQVVETPIFIILIIFTVIILSISYIYQCAFCIFAHSLYYKYLFLSMNLSNYLYLIISSIISDFVILSKTSVANRLDFSVLEI